MSPPLNVMTEMGTDAVNINPKYLMLQFTMTSIQIAHPLGVQLPKIPLAFFPLKLRNDELKTDSVIPMGV